MRRRRCFDSGFLHFITTSCYRRRPLLASRSRRNLFLKILEQVRVRYGFAVIGYVVMPEHVHLLLSEPERDHPSTVMQVLKQRFARPVLKQMRPQKQSVQSALWPGDLDLEHVWQRRYYDFVVRTGKKRVEKLQYMHRNPVKRGLVLAPEQWAWSSYRWYAYGEAGPVLVNEERKAELKIGTRQRFDQS